jgi:hypothetical protein
MIIFPMSLEAWIVCFFSINNYVAALMASCTSFYEKMNINIQCSDVKDALDNTNTINQFIVIFNGYEKSIIMYAG